eukprot:6718849-Karenia_brevis.AAC.1
MAQRVVKLLSGGHISRAIRLLSNEGLGNLADERIVEQLRRKHPVRKEAMPDLEDGAAPYPRLH